MTPRKLITLSRHIAEEQRGHPEATGTFTRLLWDLSLAARLVSREVNMAGLADIFGATDSHNPTGDAQQKLDVFAEERFLALGEGGYLCAMASEEQDGVVPIPESYACGGYVLVLDPLDGSSNIDVNASLGTIFGIYRRSSPDGGQGTEADVLQPGRRLACAGYVVYGSSTMLVYSTGHGVHGFTLDPSLGEFVLSHPHIRMPERGSIYSVNEGNQHTWDEPTRRYVGWLRSPDPGAGKQAYALRYIGTLVADFHRTLLKGGVFLYPSDASEGRPRPKLRLVYELNPIAWLAEQAGGRSSAEGASILDLVPTALHAKAALCVGSRFEVEAYERMRAEAR